MADKLKIKHVVSELFKNDQNAYDVQQTHTKNKQSDQNLSHMKNGKRKKHRWSRYFY